VAKFFNSSAASSSSQPMASATSLNISLLHSYIPLVGLTASEIWVFAAELFKVLDCPFLLCFSWYVDLCVLPLLAA